MTELETEELSMSMTDQTDRATLNSHAAALLRCIAELEKRNKRMEAQIREYERVVRSCHQCRDYLALLQDTKTGQTDAQRSGGK